MNLQSDIAGELLLASLAFANAKTAPRRPGL